MNKRSSVLFFFLYQLISTGAVMAAPQWKATHFGACPGLEGVDSREGVMVSNGAWWTHSFRAKNPVEIGGSYITSRRTISTSVYRTDGKDERYEVTGISLWRYDGKVVDTPPFWLQISDMDIICG